MKIKNVCLLSLHRLEETYGGIESFTSTLLAWLSEKEIDVSVVGRRLSILKPVFVSNSFIKEKKPDVLTIKLPKLFYALGMLFYSLSSVMVLFKFFRRKGIDLIHSQDLNFAGLAGVILSKLFNVPLITHSHGPPLYLLSKSFSTSSIWRVIENLLIRITVNSSEVIFVTDKKTEKIISSFAQQQAKIICLPTAINLRYYQNIGSDRKLISNTGELILGFIGRLAPQKNPEMILKAISILGSNNRVKLFIIGDGPIRTRLEEKAKSLRINDKVLFFGAVSDNKKLDLLRNMDVFLMPSIEEGCSIGLLEAMATGKAIVASNISSIRAVVKHDEEAILVNPHVPEELKQVILLLSNNPRLRTTLGLRAKEKAKFYDVDKVYGQLLRVYEELVLSKKKKPSRNLHKDTKNLLFQF